MTKLPFVLLSLLVTLGGCTATSEYMRPRVTLGPLQPPPGQALIVFVRPSAFASGMKFAILNHEGHFLGESVPESNFAVPVPPGRHLFISWAENTAALQATVAAGKTYFVEIAPKMGAWSARCQLLAITPRHPSWAKVNQWLHETRAYDPDYPAGEAYFARRRDDVMERVRRGQEAMTKYDPAELAERVIVPEDGR